MIVSREGYILTNDHVVEGVTDIQVTLHDGRTVLGKIVGTDPDTDLAVVRIAATGLTPITFGQSDQARVGDVVLAIGDPFSVGQTVTMGIVSAVGPRDRHRRLRSELHPDRRRDQPGQLGRRARRHCRATSSASTPLIFSRSGGYQGIGFAIPVSLAKRVMEQIIETGTVTRGWFGVGRGRHHPGARRVAGAQGHARRDRRAPSSAAAPPRRAASAWAT